MHVGETGGSYPQPSERRCFSGGAPNTASAFLCIMGNGANQVTPVLAFGAERLLVWGSSYDPNTRSRIRFISGRLSRFQSVSHKVSPTKFQSFRRPKLGRGLLSGIQCVSVNEDPQTANSCHRCCLSSYVGGKMALNRPTHSDLSSSPSLDSCEQGLNTGQAPKLHVAYLNRESFDRPHTPHGQRPGHVDYTDGRVAYNDCIFCCW